MSLYYFDGEIKKMDVCQTIQNYLDVSKERKTILFGAGEMCLRFLNHISDQKNVNDIEYIVDNSSNRIGKKLYGIPIVSTNILNEINDDYVIVITSSNHIEEIYCQIRETRECAVFSASILLSSIASTVAQELFEGQEKIKEVEAFLYDDESRYIYSEVVRRRMLFGITNYGDLMISGDAEYRIPIMYADKPPMNEVIIDAGAYNGDSLKRFVQTFGPKLKKVYCFEIMDNNLEKLRKTVGYILQKNASLNIKVIPCALSDHKGKMTFAKTTIPTGGFLVDNRQFAIDSKYEYEATEVDVDTLDNLINKEKVTLIKMDIEGSEYEALMGAEQLIKTYHPNLAISIYHCGKDYYRLAMLVKKYVPEYKIAIRHHSDGPTETDMYCWV